MKFDYGKEGIELNLDPSWNVTVFHPIKQEVIREPKKKIKEAINNPIGCLPLKEIIKSKDNLNTVCIVASDATRPVPSNLILEPLIEELNEYGIPDNHIKILIATGLHRPSHEDELDRILGKNLRNRIKTINHIATDIDSMIDLGKIVDDIPIYINKHYFKADLKILTGYVEPHFFFGFAGGRKSIIPGISGAQTIQANHSAELIGSPHARFGVYKENPMHKNSIEGCKLVGVDFIINVCINENHQITQVGAGDIEKTHEMLVNYQMTHIFKEIQESYDIVVCGNGGYPLDINLYQAVKSMAIGEMGVKKGGTIISVNECADGIGIGQDNFKELLFSERSPKQIYKKILKKEIVVPDQWEIQVLARVLMKAEIFVVSRLKERELGNIGLKYAETIKEAILISLKKHGTNARILILPNGPQILPFLV